MKTKIAAAVAVALSVVSCYAQDKIKTNGMGGGGFTIGYGYMDVSRLHRFVPSEIRSFSNSQLMLGGEGHGIIGKLVLGGSGSGFIGSEIRTDSLRISLGGGMGSFDIGYLVYNTDKVKAYPMVGIGSGGYSVNISENKNVNANQLAEDPGHEIRINKGNFLLDLSFTVNFVPVINKDDDEGSGGFMTGLKVGYIVSPKTSTWSYSGGDVTDAPDFGMNTFYVKLIIGGFGWKK